MNNGFYRFFKIQTLRQEAAPLKNASPNTRMSASGPPQKRRKSVYAARPSRVYVVIHDKEPQESGSDYVYNDMLPSKQDTKIVGIYYDYKDACEAAWEYVKCTFGIDDEDEDDDDSDSENQFSQAGGIYWSDEGWVQEHDPDKCHQRCDDRVHVQEHTVE